MEGDVRGFTGKVPAGRGGDPAIICGNQGMGGGDWEKRGQVSEERWVEEEVLSLNSEKNLSRAHGMGFDAVGRKGGSYPRKKERDGYR